METLGMTNQALNNDIGTTSKSSLVSLDLLDFLEAVPTDT